MCEENTGKAKKLNGKEIVTGKREERKLLMLESKE